MQLATKVAAWNKVQEIAKQYLPQVIETFVPYVDRKVTNRDGGWVKKLGEAINALKLPYLYSESPFSLRIDKGGGYSLVLKISLCVPEEENENSCIYFGKLRDGVLSKLDTLAEVYKDYDQFKPLEVEALKVLIGTAKSAKEAADQAEAAVPHDFRHFIRWSI